MCVSCDSQVYQAAAATGVNSGYNALVELFEAIENFLKHFDIYSKKTSNRDDRVSPFFLTCYFT